MNRLKRILNEVKSEAGQTLIEYILVLVIVVLAIVAVYNLSGITTAISNALCDVVTALGGICT